VALRVCDRIATPVLIGIVRPAILLPPALLGGLSAEQLEMILLHELAHVRRWDNLVNLLQRVVEALLFFQPAVWLVSRWVREEREHCCDAIVLRRAADPLTYADTLLEVVRMTGRAPFAGHVLATASTAARSHLPSRLRRILGREDPMQVSRTLALTVAAAIVAAVVGVCALGTTGARAQPEPKPESKFQPPAPAGPVLTVAAEGAQYTTIQTAIDAAPDGATVRIGPGVYDGDLVIRKPLTLEGAGWDRTTILAPQPDPQQVRQAQQETEQLVRQAMLQRNEAKVDELWKDLRDRLRRPAVSIDATRNVHVRGLRIAATPVHTGDGQPRSPMVLLQINDAQAHVSDCVITGSPNDGVEIRDNCDVAIRRTLVAGMWGSGVVVDMPVRTERGPDRPRTSKVLLADCDIRNCYYVGVYIAYTADVTVERCRVSGSAWHGIRFGGGPQKIIGNRIFANARTGIYADGDANTPATIKGNLFAHSQGSGVSCFSGVHHIVGNTFADNASWAITAIGPAKPTIERNIFAGNHAGVGIGAVANGNPGPQPLGQPTLRANLFWWNKEPVQIVGWDAQQNKPAGEAVKLEEGQGTVADPGFAQGPAAYVLSPESPARRDGIGALDALPADSPFPLQPEELAIVPDGPERDFKLWKKPDLKPQRVAEIPPANIAPPAEKVSYEEAFKDLYDVLGREYPCFELKNIDWNAVGKELLPRAREVKDEKAFGLLCLELVARLQDSHAMVGPAAAQVPMPQFPQWDPGLSCLIDDRGKPVIYYVDPGGPADKAAVRPGMTVVSIDGKPADEALTERMNDLKRYVGYSSDRYLRYHAAQFLARVMQRGQEVKLELEDINGNKRELALPATLNVRYLPRLPVPIPKIQDAANVSWTMLDDRTGYIYVRRIANDLIDQLDRAVAELKNAKGLIIDVRGNSGGGFDAARSFRNFAFDDPEEPNRPRFAGPIAVLIDSRCISAGEGWASWFIANKRARFFGETTAGASSRKRQHPLKNGLYTVTFPVKAYAGFLDRPIERRGLEPHEPVKQNALDLSAGRDTVLEAARNFLAAEQ
jgi:C-terminal processing protease CtpA/Prc